MPDHVPDHVLGAALAFMRDRSRNGDDVTAAELAEVTGSRGSDRTKTRRAQTIVARLRERGHDIEASRGRGNAGYTLVMDRAGRVFETKARGTMRRAGLAGTPATKPTAASTAGA